jgi:FkbM family methyltransferase
MLSERPLVSDAVVRVRDLGKEIHNSVFGRILRRTIRRAGWGARRMLGALPEDGDETAYRLGLIREDQSQKERTYSFSWGRMSYLNLGDLRAQYRDIFLKGQYEFTPDNDSPTIVDCGGNIGMSVVWFHLRYPQARITVFEPDPTSATILRRNVARFPFRRTDVLEAAAWVSTGEINFEATGGVDARVASGGGISSVKSVRLAEALPGEVDLLKLDIEGAEFEVVIDLCNTGAIARIKNIVAECHVTQDKVADFLEMCQVLRKNDMRICLSEAKTRTSLHGAEVSAPFAGLRGGQFLVELYAWR